MALIVWFAALDTGYGSMDEDHRAMAELLNQLGPLHEGSVQPSGAAPLLADLAWLMDQHFTREELLMARSGYPGTQLHRQEHDNLRRDLADVMADYANGGYAGREDALAQYLKYWLLNHVTTEDFHLADFLAKWEALPSR